MDFYSEINNVLGHGSQSHISRLLCEWLKHFEKCDWKEKKKRNSLVFSGVHSVQWKNTNQRTKSKITRIFDLDIVHHACLTIHLAITRKNKKNHTKQNTQNVLQISSKRTRVMETTNNVCEWYPVVWRLFRFFSLHSVGFPSVCFCVSIFAFF